MKLRFIALLFVCSGLCLMIYSCVRAETLPQPEVIILDDSCRLVKKPVKPTPKSKPKPATVAASAPPIIIPKIRRKPLFVKDIPPEYDLNCDDAPKLPPAPPLLVDLPFPSTVEQITVTPGDDNFPVVIPEAPLMVEREAQAETFAGSAFLPGYWLFPFPVYVATAGLAAPANPVPEPHLWVLLAAGLTFLVVIKWRRNSTFNR